MKAHFFYVKEGLSSSHCGQYQWWLLPFLNRGIEYYDGLQVPDAKRKSPGNPADEKTTQIFAASILLVATDDLNF